MVKKTAKKAAKAKAAPKKKAAQPKLLSGGNPQIAKGYGEAPVKAYIAAVPGWQKEIAKRIDALVVKIVPGVKKAVKWNSPFYGVEEGRWFLCFHIFARYVKVTFFDGADLKPPPESKSKYPRVRYYDIHEGALDEKQFVAWVKQASKLPGQRM
ncbi:MAG: DUF1801 domain-containing protein [Hyphomonadaceae bacterium]